MQCRSFGFEELKEKIYGRGYKKLYTEDTEYNETDQYLDLGYRGLDKIDMTKIESLMIRVLIVNCNNLVSLPPPEKLPCLRILDCSHNKIESIPFYPTVRELHCSYNRIKDFSAYKSSKLKILDVSHNKEINLDVHLPEILYLFAHNCGFTSLKSSNYPVLTILDCSENKLTHLETFPSAEEINAQKCTLSTMAYQPNILRLNVGGNGLKEFVPHSKLEILEIQENLLTHFPTQPNLTKLIASKNQISLFAPQPKLINCDISYNKLTAIPSLHAAQTISLHENPIKEIYNNQFNLQVIQEMNIGYKTYETIYNQFKNHVKYISINPNAISLREKLDSMDSCFNKKIRDLIHDCFLASVSNYRNHNDMLRKLTFYVFVMKYPEHIDLPASQILENEIFRTLFYQLRKLYYSSLLITLFFVDDDS